MQQPSNNPTTREKVKECLRTDILAADLRCSIFVAAVQSYKRDSVIRPFPPTYINGENKEFDALLADVKSLPSVRDVLQSGPGGDEALLDLLHWVLSSKNQTLKSLLKEEYVKIQELTGFNGGSVPPPDFLFEIVYCDQMNAKFEETKGERDLFYAFHGSRLENFHSIVHNGLHCHLNKASILSLTYSDSIDRRRARVRNSEGGDVPQKYFVVTNNQLLRVKYLLVYSEKQHRRRVSLEEFHGFISCKDGFLSPVIPNA
ncbi:UNVERIFIED_CONTAM: hypothetical protein FKN15_049139 [Acipenser sinensis]